MSPRDRRLLRLFVACVIGDWDEVRRLRAAASDGEPDRAWRETVLQVHLFAGFPRQVEAYEVLREAGGLGALEPGEAEDAADDLTRGRGLFAQIYGRNAEAVETRLVDHHADFGRWIVGHAYGRVLTRPGLTAALRELLAVGALAATGQTRQLASHARGAIHCGATAADVQAALDAVEDLVPESLRAGAREVADRFSARPKQ